MTIEYRVDERDMMFNLKECPGIEPIMKTGAFPECDEETLDMIFQQGLSFSQKKLGPLLEPTDREGCHFDGKTVKLPAGIKEMWPEYRELGVIGMMGDSAYGGADMPHFFGVPVAEMECGSFVSFSMLPLLTRGAANLVYHFGSEALKDTYVEKMFSGEWTGTMCLTEPQAGSDVGASSSKAVPHGDAFHITGTKIFITWGEHDLADNIIHLVLARIEGDPAGTKGLSLFVVPKYIADENGNFTKFNNVECGNIEHKLGIAACPTCLMNFGAGGTCTGYLVGEPRNGIRYMFQLMNEARFEVGIQGMALSSAAYLAALAYAKERKQGSVKDASGVRQAAIVEHPDVRRMLLKMRAIVEGSRAMIYNMAQYIDLSHHHPEESEKYQALVELLTPICKSYASDQGFRVTEWAMQTFGGYGYCKDYPAELYLRDIKISSIYEGTNGIQALDLLFRKIMMNQGKNLKIWLSDVHALCAELKDSSLGHLALQLSDAANALGLTASTLGEAAAGGKVEAVQFQTTDFQTMMGHILVGYYLLKQAKVAQAALDGGASGEDAHFYRQKLVTCGFHFETAVAESMFGLKQIQSLSTLGLDAAW